jgi:CubicO group peptidase (beta-lactamase class C family)
MKPMKAYVLVLLLSLRVWAQQPADIDAIFKKWDRKTVPGGAVGVVKDGRLVYAHGYGLANISNQTPNTSRTNFDLASVSKQFTAASILLLAERKKLRLDDRLDKFFPKLPEYAAPVRLENLLTMTSGLPDYDDSLPTDENTLLKTLRRSKPTFSPGARYEYLNMNYALLSFVAERADGRKLGQIMSQELFAPLGMQNTCFLQEAGQKVPNRATGYIKKPKGWRVSQNDVPGVGDGNVFSNVEDLSLWLLKHPFPEHKGDGYGYGLEYDRHANQQRISHTGSWSGTSTYISYYPKARFGVIVLGNREDADAYGLGEKVEDLYLAP